MRLLATILALLALAATGALAAPVSMPFTVAYTAGPADADPNSSAPAAAVVFTMRDVCFTLGTTSIGCRGIETAIYHSNALTTCDIKPWAKNSSSGKWHPWVQLDDASVGPGYYWDAPPSTLFFQVSGCLVGTINASAPLTLYVGDY
jgi:hypothetical protein